MKKIIRLTESDLTRIVRRVIKEQQTGISRQYLKEDDFRGGVTLALMNQLTNYLNGMIPKAKAKNITMNSVFSVTKTGTATDKLGNPIPKEGADSVKGDFNNPTEFEFAYEIGLTPKVEVELSAKNKYDYVKVKVDAELVNKQIDDLRRRYGKLVSSEKVGEKDLILAQFVELKEDGSVLEGGILNSSTISMEFVEDAATKKALTGKKQGDKVEIEPSKVSRGEKDTAAMLGITEDQLSSISSKFKICINLF